MNKLWLFTTICVCLTLELCHGKPKGQAEGISILTSMGYHDLIVKIRNKCPAIVKDHADFT